MKAVVAAFNQEKALVGSFSVITNLRMDIFEALVHVDFHNIHYLQLPLKLISRDIQILIFISELHDNCNI